MRFLVSLIIWTLAVGASSAETRTLSIPPGAPFHISNPHNWSDDCRVGWIRVFLTAPPQNGRVYVEQMSHKIGDFGNGRLTTGELNGCVGRLIDGASLFYHPNDGFVGTEAFSVKVEFEFIPDLDVDYVVQVGP